MNLKESYFQDFVIEDYAKIINNKEEKINDKNELENIITDDGSGQLFKYYENLKKKKMKKKGKKAKKK